MKIRINHAYHERGGLSPEPYYLEFKDWNEAMPELFRLHERLIIATPDSLGGLEYEDIGADFAVTLYDDYVE